jgi:hypothetical protein
LCKRMHKIVILSVNISLLFMGPFFASMKRFF